MATKLTKPVHRESNKTFNRRNVIVTVAPGTGTRDDMIGMRLKGEREQYIATVESIYRVMALWHANKIKAAKAAARKAGTPWREAKKAFNKIHRINL